MNNKISIILSTYNEYQTVEKTISEIFLKLENVEIIVVDDNSNDGTLEKLNSIKDENLKVFSRNTRGLASAFLLGMINTNGNYIGWTNSNMPQLVTHFNNMKEELKNHDIVLLSRYVKGGSDQRSKLRVFSSKVINFSVG